MAAVHGSGDDPVAKFCTQLRRLQERSGLDAAELAQRLAEYTARPVGRSQLYRILNGQIDRPPRWNSAVKPIVQACAGDHPGIIVEWRTKYDQLLGAYAEFKRHRKPVTEPQSVRTLPTGTAVFTGRHAQLDQIRQAAAEAVQNRSTVICVVHGMPGVGKTALALHAAHLLEEQFPHGQLHIDLSAYSDPRVANMTDGLTDLLTLFGFAPKQIPADSRLRAARWRNVTAGRKLLLILDDAAGIDQVTPLLPGSAQCLVIVTSQSVLQELRGDYGAKAISLEPLAEGEAVELFQRVAGPTGEAADPEAARDVVQECGCLPLAISIAAASMEVSTPIEELLSALRAQNPVSAIDGYRGDVGRGVVAAFDLAFRKLSLDEQRMLRMMSVVPGTDIDAHAAAALSDLPRADADAMMKRLVTERHLVERAGSGRYRLHSLVKAFILTWTPDSEREPAVQRLDDHYWRTAEAADTYLAGHTRPHRPPLSYLPGEPPVHDRVQAQRRMSADRDNMFACIDRAGTDHRDSAMVKLTAAMAGFLQSTGPWRKAIQLHTAAAGAAARLDDPAAQADALFELGVTRYLVEDHEASLATLRDALHIYGRIDSFLGQANCVYQRGLVRKVTGDEGGAIIDLELALAMYRDTGDELGQANAQTQLGAVRYLADDYPAAAHALAQAVTIYRRIDHEPGEATALVYSGAVRQETDDYPGATKALAEARGIFRAIENTLGEANALNQLGTLQQITGEYEAAEADLREALNTYRQMGIRISAANALDRLGAVYTATGELDRARPAFDEALSIFRQTGNRLGQADVSSDSGLMMIRAGEFKAATTALRDALGIFQADSIQLGEATTLNRLGMLHRADGDNEAARPFHQQALRVARSIPSLLEQARALEGLGQCAVSEPGRTEAAQQARRIFREIGAAEAGLGAPEDGQS